MNLKKQYPNMKNFVVKLEVTNDVNDNRRVEWKFFDTIDERDAWVEIMKDEEYEWNNNTEGALSIRDYEFRYYDKENILRQELSDFAGMTIEAFFDVLKWYWQVPDPPTNKNNEPSNP
jgi:hypothetical protein